MKRYASELAPEEIFNEAAKLLATDRTRFAGTNYPVYKGQTISPMSSATQRARELHNQFNNRPAPYSNKIQNVLGRSNQINPAIFQGQLNNLGGAQQNFNTNAISRILGKQYRQSYNPATSPFMAKSNKDIQRQIPETAAHLQDIGRNANVLEQSSNQTLAERLRSLAAQKEDRRKGLVGTLEQFGAQKHGYNNLANSVNRNEFEQEATAPGRRMDMLAQSLNPLSMNMDSNVLPELKKQSALQALQALRAYGVDTNRPVDEWGAIRNTGTSYPGQLIAGLPPEILASHSTLESMSPQFRGSTYTQGKNIMRQMMGNPSVGDTALGGVEGRMRPEVNGLETAAKRRLKQDLALINQQFIQANQFGSPLHIKTAEDRARDLSRATLEQRGKLLENTNRSELALGHQQQQSKLKQMGMLGDTSQSEYQNMLNAIRNTNNLGATKFANEQAENEDLYKNYQNESGWEWPHLKGAISKEARQGALGDVFRGLENRNISLDNLAALNTNYSESQKELQGARANLQTRDTTIADLQKQLGIFKQQQATQAAQAEVQRRAQEEQAAKVRTQQQAEAKKQADQAAEARRLRYLEQGWREDPNVPGGFRRNSVYDWAARVGGRKQRDK